MKHIENFNLFDDFIPPGMKFDDFVIIGNNIKYLDFYSKKLELFEPIKIKLLRNLSDIYKDRLSENDYLDIQDIIDDDNLLSRQICEMEATPGGIHIEYGGHTYYTIYKPKDLIENEDFIFI